MNKLTTKQLITIGVACLFGIPICIGLVVGHFAGFWVGVIATVFTIAFIAFIAQRWWQKRARQNEGKDDDNKD